MCHRSLKTDRSPMYLPVKKNLITSNMTHCNGIIYKGQYDPNTTCVTKVIFSGTKNNKKVAFLKIDNSSEINKSQEIVKQSKYKVRTYRRLKMNLGHIDPNTRLGLNYLLMCFFFFSWHYLQYNIFIKKFKF